VSRQARTPARPSASPARPSPEQVTDAHRREAAEVAGPLGVDPATGLRARLGHAEDAGGTADAGGEG
jgi:hypothetical protein